MTTALDLDPAQQIERLNEALESVVCYCGNPKRMQLPFCLHCFNRLPDTARKFVALIKDETSYSVYTAALELLEKP